MHMHRAPRVVAREDSRELRDPVRVRHPRAAEPGLLEVGARECREQPRALAADLRLLVLEARARHRVPGVVPSSISMPDVDEDVGERAAGLDVDNTDVEELDI